MSFARLITCQLARSVTFRIHWAGQRSLHSHPHLLPESMLSSCLLTVRTVNPASFTKRCMSCKALPSFLPAVVSPSCISSTWGCRLPAEKIQMSMPACVIYGICAPKDSQPGMGTLSGLQLLPAGPWRQKHSCQQPFLTLDQQQAACGRSQPCHGRAR